MPRSDVPRPSGATRSRDLYLHVSSVETPVPGSCASPPRSRLKTLWRVSNLDDTETAYHSDAMRLLSARNGTRNGLGWDARRSLVSRQHMATIADTH